MCCGQVIMSCGLVVCGGRCGGGCTIVCTNIRYGYYIVSNKRQNFVVDYHSPPHRLHTQPTTTIHAHTHTYTKTQTHTYEDTHTHTKTHTHIHTRRHTHTHTHEDTYIWFPTFHPYSQPDMRIYAYVFRWGAIWHSRFVQKLGSRLWASVMWWIRLVFATISMISSGVI